MVIGCALGYIIFNVKSQGGQCHHTWDNLYMAVAIYSTYLYLFARYFYFAYIRKATAKKPTFMPPCALQTEQAADEDKKATAKVQDQAQDQDAGYRFVLVGNNNEYDYYKKKFEASETGRRRKSAKRFEADTPIITDIAKKRA